MSRWIGRSWKVIVISTLCAGFSGLPASPDKAMTALANRMVNTIKTIRKNVGFGNVLLLSIMNKERVGRINAASLEKIEHEFVDNGFVSRFIGIAAQQVELADPADKDLSRFETRLVTKITDAVVDEFTAYDDETLAFMGSLTDDDWDKLFATVHSNFRTRSN